jgi:FkbM family methyltransferase
MIDVGANAGYFSLLWTPRNVELFRDNLESNGLTDRTCLYACAAGREEGRLDFAPGPKEQTGWGGLAAQRSEDTFTVDVRCVDSVVATDAPVSLLKIDTEGADTWVLMGCEGLLRKHHIAEVHFEQNKPRMRALGIGDEDAADFLGEVGYEMAPLSDPGGDVVDWVATPA